MIFTLIHPPAVFGASKFFCRSLRQDSISELRESQAYCACKGFTWPAAGGCDGAVDEKICPLWLLSRFYIIPKWNHRICS